MEIEDQAVDVAAAVDVEKFPTGGEFESSKARALEQKPKRIPYSVITVQNQDHRLFPSVARCHSFAGATSPP